MTWVVQLHMLFAVPPVLPRKIFSTEKIFQELLSVWEKRKMSGEIQYRTSHGPTAILELILKRFWQIQIKAVAPHFEFCTKIIKVCFSKAMSLKLNRILSSAWSSFFVAVLYLACTDCSTVVRASHCSAWSSAPNAGFGDCSVRLQSYTAEMLSF